MVRLVSSQMEDEIEFERLLPRRSTVVTKPSSVHMIDIKLGAVVTIGVSPVKDGKAGFP